MYFRVLGLYKINSHHILILYSNYEMLQSAWDWDWDDHPDTKKYEEEALARAFSHQVWVPFGLSIVFSQCFTSDDGRI